MSVLAQVGRRLVIAHRGASAAYPENTMAAFGAALAAGADAIELDVRLAGDGTPVVLHDATVDRTTGGHGRADQLDAAALAGLGVPTLHDVLEAFPTAPLLIEIKEARAAAPVAELLTATNAGLRCAVGAAHPAALLPFRGGSVAVCGSAPEIRGALWRAVLGAGPAPNRGYSLLSVPVRHRGIPVAVPSLMRAARRAGFAVHVWTVDDAELAARLWTMGATGIVTNDPARMIRVRETLRD